MTRIAVVAAQGEYMKFEVLKNGAERLILMQKNSRSGFNLVVDSLRLEISHILNENLKRLERRSLSLMENRRLTALLKKTHSTDVIYRFSRRRLSRRLHQCSQDSYDGLDAIY